VGTAVQELVEVHTAMQQAAKAYQQQQEEAGQPQSM
jgi:hypothetical protein